jgi:hypothetical protein
LKTTSLCLFFRPSMNYYNGLTQGSATCGSRATCGSLDVKLRLFSSIRKYYLFYKKKIKNFYFKYKLHLVTIGFYHGLIWDVIPSLFWMDWLKPRKIYQDNQCPQIGNFSNTSKKVYRFSQSAMMFCILNWLFTSINKLLIHIVELLNSANNYNKLSFFNHNIHNF